MDVLSDVLRMIRLEGALFLNGDFHDPWCVQTPSGAELARLLLPAGQPLAVCHFVLEGQCWVLPQAGAPVRLQAGEIAVFPHGEPHQLSSDRRLMPARFDDVVQPRLPELNRVRYGGDGERTVIVCGWFAFERELPNPLLATLPGLFTACLRQRPSGPWIEQSVRHALEVASSHQPGAQVMSAKVAELLFVEALRGHVEALPPAQTGWLAGLRDPQVGRCLALLHAEPQRAWSVAELAQAVNLSRSALAQRFTELLQVPPMQYLKRWRLATAARLLCSGSRSLAQVAGSIGYESEAAFNRAFKREYGVSPGVWRRGASGSPAKAQP